MNVGDQGQITAITQDRAKEAPEDSVHTLMRAGIRIGAQCQLQLSVMHSVGFSKAQRSTPYALSVDDISQT